jgi:hypothetical protein
LLYVLLLACLQTPAAAQAPLVSIVRSDDPALPAPIDTHSRLAYARHIRPMVRRAVAERGLRAILDAADAGDDGILDVVCKVNIVHAEHVQGDVTDWRVVKGLLETIHAWAHGTTSGLHDRHSAVAGQLTMGAL